MLAFLSVLCLGAAVLFAFFAVLGEVSLGSVLALSIVLAVLLTLAAVHALLVRRDLHTHGNQDSFRTQNRLRERRGF